MADLHRGQLGCTDIAGATGSSFAVGSSQVGSKLRAMVTATNSAGKTSAFSNLTTAVVAKRGLTRQHDAAADLRLGLDRADAPGLDRRLDGRRDEPVRLPVESL